MLSIILWAIYLLRSGSKVYKYIVGIPMRIGCVNFFFRFVLRETSCGDSDNNQTEAIEAFSFISRYQDE